jgi:CRISPR-associated endonuclease/helicase Cas3
MTKREAMIYWAHSDRDGLKPEDPGAQWQRLSVHLKNVASLAATLAEAARPGDPDFRQAAYRAGLLHDLGKYTECFQRMIRTKQGKCPHAAHGAAVAYKYGDPDASFAVVGHHSGIPDLSGKASWQARVMERMAEATALRQTSCADLPDLAQMFEPAPLRPNLALPDAVAKFDLHTRMLFSCLVDADRLDSAGRTFVPRPLDADAQLAKLVDHINRLRKGRETGTVNDARENVLSDCITGAAMPERLLSLTVPTGGGKTLSAMAFALKRAQLNPHLYRRIIVVIPYLSIIEQNAEVYTGIFGPECVLEHHSGSFDRLQTRAGDDQHFVAKERNEEETTYTPEAHRNATENWNEPLIVTTSVRFFESLFSNRPADLRRVHNIARSIVILDEVQTLPRRLLAPLLAMIRELSAHWGCTFVFSTATQPAFQKSPEAPPGPKDSRWEPGAIREIIQNPDELRRALKRVKIEWELDAPTAWPSLASRLSELPAVLCVVNLRDHAAELFDALLQQCPPDGCFHLSTRMCAAHRLAVLSEIRRRLAVGLVCRVVSTQLIEAGVDVDFPIAFRAVGPLDAIFQVAGRVDREGKRTAVLGSPAGRLIVFRSPDDKTPPNDYKEATQSTFALAQRAIISGLPIQPESVADMEIFWQRYYGEEQDQGQELQQLRLQKKFATLADQFEMISSRTLDVFVPYDDRARTAIDDLRKIGQLTKELRHDLQRYTVGLQPYELEKAKGALEEIRKDSGIWAAVEGAYTESKGLKTSLGIEDTII